MTATAWGVRPRTSGKRIVWRVVGLLLVLALSAVVFIFSYWFGLLLLFVGLAVVVSLTFRSYEGRTLWLLALGGLFVAALVGSLAQIFVAGAVTADTATGFLMSVLIGLVAAIAAVIIPFFVLVAVATIGLAKWHITGKEIPFARAYRFLLSSILGLGPPSVAVDGSEIKGSERDKERLESFGGPGWLTVYPGQVVVLHERGKITRAAGSGSTMLKRGEQLKAIVPLTRKGGINEIENVLTRDKVPLSLKVLHLAQVEPAAETRERLAEEVRLTEESGDEKALAEARQHRDALTNDPVVGDDFNQVYESVAIRAAMRAPDVWAALKAPIANIIRDVIMTLNFDELFNLTEEGRGLEGNMNNRKVAEIEKIVFNRAKGSAPRKGLVLGLVDVNEIQFPPEISDKINQEAAASVDGRIRQIEARSKELTARLEAQAKKVEAELEETVAHLKGRAQLQLARAEAQAEALRAGARAELYRHVIRVLKEQDQSEDTIKAVLKNLAVSDALEHELRRIQDFRSVYPQPEPPPKGLPEKSDSKA